LQIELLVRWARPSRLRTQLSLTAGILSVLDAAAIGLLSFFYHNRSVRPSTILQLYLFISLLFDVARTRTLWLVRSDAVLAGIFTAATASKSLMLCLETIEKRRILEPAFRNLMREATSGFANLSIFWSLNEPLKNGAKNGAKNVIALTDLDELRGDFHSEALQLSLEETWEQGSRRNLRQLCITDRYSCSKRKPFIVACHREDFPLATASRSLTKVLPDRIYLCATFPYQHFDQVH
jgi:ATP-binding cassette, subfamily C (CFTR/MRP), member 1